MSILQAIVLGIFQGIAEFLPISSSGHLVLLGNLFGITEGNLFFTIMLHFGSLISIFIVYFKDILQIIVSFFSLIGDLIRHKRFKLNDDHKILTVMLIVGTIPTGLIGILFNDFFESLYSSLLPVGIALLVTGALLRISEKKASGKKQARDFKVMDAVFIGIFQGFAIIPGVSRSGSTIVGGLFRGLDKKLATKFSFLLALPAIMGATILEVPDAIEMGISSAILLPTIIGVIFSAITGVFAIKILVKMLEKGKLHYFAYYVWALGLVVIATQLIN